MENNYQLIVAIVLLCFLLYQEFRRVNRKRLFLRLLAVSTAVSALLLLLFPLKYTAERPYQPDTLHLITAGESRVKLKSHPYYTTDSDVLSQYKDRQIRFIPDLAYYLRMHREIRGLKVYGYGLADWQLKGLENYVYDFQPSVLPNGVVSCFWPRFLKETSLLEVQGTYNNQSALPVKLYLEGMGGTEDSVIVKAKTLMQFGLKSQPKQLGRVVYHLKAIQQKATLSTSAIPFQVLESAKVKVLMLSSFPDFEDKFLKNWLFASRYQVVIRTQVSKEKWSTDYLNTTMAELDAGKPGDFDLVIAGEEELAALGEAAKNSLYAEVNRGLGLLVRVDEHKIIHPLPAEEVVLKGDSNRVRIVSGLYGNGKIAHSSLSSTYRWVLAAEQQKYAKFWSDLITALARKEKVKASWRVVPDLPVVREQAALMYEATARDSLMALAVNGAPVSFLQHTILLYSFKGLFWPQHPGWNERRTAEGVSGYFYVFDAKDWAGIKAQEKLMLNQFYAEKSVDYPENVAGISVGLEKEVSAWWWFFLFLVSVTYIWFETKLL